MNSYLVQIPVSPEPIPIFDRDLVALAEGSILGAICIFLILNLWSEHRESRKFERRIKEKLIDNLVEHFEDEEPS